MFGVTPAFTQVVDHTFSVARFNLLSGRLRIFLIAVFAAALGGAAATAAVLTLNAPNEPTKPVAKATVVTKNVASGSGNSDGPMNSDGSTGHGSTSSGSSRPLDERVTDLEDKESTRAAKEEAERNAAEEAKAEAARQEELVPEKQAEYYAKHTKPQIDELKCQISSCHRRPVPEPDASPQPQEPDPEPTQAENPNG